jgi:GNAT superfamily N-acetyltransferase
MSLLGTLMMQTNAYKNLNCEFYFRIYIFCIHPSYQEKDVETALLKACIEVASTLNLPAVGCIFTSGFHQTVAYNVGFRVISKIRYSCWIVDDKMVFVDPGKGNYSAAFMGMRIESEGTPRESADDSATTDHPLAN